MTRRYFFKNPFIIFCASADTRRSAIAFAVIGAASAIDQVRDSSKQRFRGAHRFGAIRGDLDQVFVDPVDQIRGGHDRVDEADVSCVRGVEAAAGDEQLARSGLADLRQHVRRNHRRDQARASLR